MKRWSSSHASRLLTGEVVLASAEDLPFADASFSAVAMSIVFFFLANPVAVLRECRRVLRPGGRIAVATTGPELRGTAAAPEPIASQGHFYTDAALAELARRAGLSDVEVHNHGGGQLLTAAAEHSAQRRARPEPPRGDQGSGGSCGGERPTGS